MLIRATARAATCQFTVNYDRGHAADAVMLRFGCHFGLVHVVDRYLMRRPSKALNYLDCFLARSTTSAQYFNFLFFFHTVLLDTPVHFFCISIGKPCLLVV